MTTTAATADQLQQQIEEQRRLVAEAEEVVRRREEWDAEQHTTASRAGLIEARRDATFYRNALRRLEARHAEAVEVSR